MIEREVEALSNQLFSAWQRIEALEHRIAGMLRPGNVAEVDTSDPTATRVRIAFGEDDGQQDLAPPIPYSQVAGALKLHSPPSKDQPMLVLAPGGDRRQAVAIPLTFSEGTPSPSNKSDEHVLEFGSLRIEARGGELVVKVPRLFVECDGTTFELTGAGLKAVAPDYQFD